MYLCTSIIQYIVTYRHKKLRKFDKKIQAFQGLRKIFIYSTVKEPSIEIGFDGTRAEMLGCHFFVVET